MRRTIGLAALALTTSACGASPEEDAEALHTYGTAQQAYLVGLRGGTVQFGTKTDSTGLMCTTTTPSQTCAIPSKKDIRVFLSTPSGSGAATAAQIQVVRSKLFAWNNALAGQGRVGWTFSETSSSTDPLITHFVNVVGGSSTGSCAGSGGTNIEQYACLSGPTVSLSEDSGVVGNYVARTQTNISVDIQNIQSKGANATEDDNLARHAVFNVMHKSVGIGSIDPGSERCAARSLDGVGLGTACTVTVNEACILTTFGELSDTTSFGFNGTTCGF
ncbi:MAG: hypothetical protein ABI895_00990 [Deltaproteobacteria bacterium]